MLKIRTSNLLRYNSNGFINNSQDDTRSSWSKLISTYIHSSYFYDDFLAYLMQ